MKKRILSYLTALVLLLAAGLVHAQGEQGSGGDVLMPTEVGGWLIGPIGGVNLVTYSTDQFPLLGLEPTCFLAQNGSDIAPFVGVSALLPLNAETMQNFIMAEVIFDSKSSKFTAINNGSTQVLTKYNGVTKLGYVNTSASANLTYMTLNLGYKYNFTPAPTPVGPSIQAVLSTGIKMTSSITRTVEVSAAVGTSNVASKTDVLDPSSIRLALRAMFAYDIPITETWVASPTVGYDLALTKVNSNAIPGNWKANSAFAGVAVRALVGR
ncbi:MAG: hypothetical protein JSS75_10635 [Bacteroidetes bacterium]|nr:hypothetical protein [Bacteroidota bacterium]